MLVTYPSIALLEMDCSLFESSKLVFEQELRAMGIKCYERIDTVFDN